MVSPPVATMLINQGENQAQEVARRDFVRIPPFGEGLAVLPDACRGRSCFGNAKHGQEKLQRDPDVKNP